MIIKKQRNINLTEGSIMMGIIYFTIPLLLSNFLQQLYNTADLIIVGKFAGKNPMAAVGSTAQVSSLLLGLFFGLATGASVVISQTYGSGNRSKLKKSIVNAYAISIFGGLLLTIVGYVLSPWMLRITHTPAEIFDDANKYLRIFFFGIIPLLVYNMGSGILRSMGDSKRPFNFLVVAAIVNIVLDLIFIAIFKMGVAGAGWATLIAQVVSSILVTYSLLKSDQVGIIKKADLKLEREILLNIFNIGLPAGLQSVIISFSNVLIQAKLNKFGPDIIAAFSAGGRIDSFIFMGIIAITISATTFTGQNIGAKKYHRVIAGTKVAINITLVTTAITSIIIFVFATDLVKLFNTDPEVVKYGAIYMRYLCSTYFIFGVSEILGGVVRGAGYAMPPMLTSLVFMCGIRMIWIYVVLNIIYKVEIIFMAWPVTWVFAFISNYIYFKKGKWREVLNPEEELGLTVELD